MPQPIDVFISRKSEDAHLAKPLYDFLKSKGLQVFDSDYSLPELGNADYQRAIDQALETCEHMIVVGSSVENICSSWVDAEWRLFISEKRAGYKPGNILTAVARGMPIRSLPASLRYYEVIFLEEKNYERIYAYVGRKSNSESNSIPNTIQPISSTPTTDLLAKSELSLLLSSLIHATRSAKSYQQPIKLTPEVINHWHVKGERFYKSKDYVNAVLYFSKAAEQGHADSQFELGRCYHHGYGLVENYTEAVKWYRKAVEQGNMLAQTNLGACYYYGQGVQQDYAEAIKWFHKAAEQGDDFAQQGLGTCYSNGQGVGQDYAKGVTWFRKAAEQGNANAQAYLGACYYDGQGVGQDYVKAATWYRKAAEQGNAAGQNGLGACYYSGYGVKQNYTQAIGWFRKAAEQGDAFSQQSLGVCYDYGLGVKQDYAEAVKWYRKAAEQDNADAQLNLGHCYENGHGIKQNKESARIWYKKAAESGNEEAKKRLKNLGNNSFWNKLLS